MHDYAKNYSNFEDSFRLAKKCSFVTMFIGESERMERVKVPSVRGVSMVMTRRLEWLNERKTNIGVVQCVA
jgi:hypothetical protein